MVMAPSAVIFEASSKKAAPAITQSGGVECNGTFSALAGLGHFHQLASLAADLLGHSPQAHRATTWLKTWATLSETAGNGDAVVTELRLSLFREEEVERCVAVAPERAPSPP